MHKYGDTGYDGTKVWTYSLVNAQKGTTKFGRTKVTTQALLNAQKR